MSAYSFELAGKKFEVKVPQGVTEEQAKALFKQQADTGSLVGIKVGDALSAATQAAAGLPGAVAQLQQSAAGALGSLPGAANLNSITAGLGAAAGAVNGQISAALAGPAAALNSLTSGAGGLGSLGSAVTGAAGGALSGIVGGAASKLPSVGTLSGAITNLVTDATSSLGAISTGVSVAKASSAGLGSALSGALTGAAGTIGSLASQAVSKLQGAIGGAATNGINVADFAKQLPALGSIGNMKLPDVTGTLAQASKLVGQGAGTISNALGAGKFGLDAGQLEKAGLVKPGTAAAFLAKGANDLVSVLQSPTVWTGKDGVKDLGGLLKNPGLQDKVQQDLMKTGLDSLKSVGIPTDKLSPQALSGLATNAAKSVTDTVAWAKNAPGLPADIKTKFDANAVNGAFAVKLTQTKVDPPVKQEEKPAPASATANSETQEAASSRVVGNDKVPAVTESDATGNAKTKINAYIDFITSIYDQTKALEPTVNAYEAAASITQQQWETLNAEYLTIAAQFNSTERPLQKAAVEAQNAMPDSAPAKVRLKHTIEAAQNAARALGTFARALRQRIKDLANKIVVSGEQNG